MTESQVEPRSHTCGALQRADIGKTVRLMGWVNKLRDFGQMTFVDLRDRYGITQLVVDREANPKLHDRVRALRHEFVLSVRGVVQGRPEGMVNQERATGDIEVALEELEVLNECAVLPISLDDQTESSEALRFQYRYLDLRRPHLQQRLIARSRLTGLVRRNLEAMGFLDIETPFLYKSTPEGAREFLVPSRVNPGSFYALPQSPQLFKQILMVSGFDRYYQIVRCFRDEDLRVDRQPEFTQIDIEMSFVDQEQVMQTIESFVQKTVHEFLGREVFDKIPRLTFQKAMEEYGCDKPDTRFGLKLQDVTSLVKDCPVFAEAIAAGGIANAIVVPGAAEKYSRKRLEEASGPCRDFGAKGLMWGESAGRSKLAVAAEKILYAGSTAGFESTRWCRRGRLGAFLRRKLGCCEGFARCRASELRQVGGIVRPERPAVQLGDGVSSLGSGRRPAQGASPSVLHAHALRTCTYLIRSRRKCGLAPTT